MTSEEIFSYIGTLHIGTILFAVALAIFWIHSIFIQYHLIRFGIGRLPKQLSLVTIAGSLAISILAVIAFFNMKT